MYLDDQEREKFGPSPAATNETSLAFLKPPAVSHVQQTEVLKKLEKALSSIRRVKIEQENQAASDQTCTQECAVLEVFSKYMNDIKKNPELAFYSIYKKNTLHDKEVLANMNNFVATTPRKEEGEAISDYNVRAESFYINFLGNIDSLSFVTRFEVMRVIFRLFSMIESKSSSTIVKERKIFSTIEDSLRTSLRIPRQNGQ